MEPILKTYLLNNFCEHDTSHGDDLFDQCSMRVIRITGSSLKKKQNDQKFDVLIQSHSFKYSEHSHGAMPMFLILNQSVHELWKYLWIF